MLYILLKKKNIKKLNANMAVKNILKKTPSQNFSHILKANVSEGGNQNDRLHKKSYI